VHKQITIKHNKKGEIYKSTPKSKGPEKDEETSNLMGKVTKDMELLLVGLNLDSIPKPLRLAGSPFFHSLLVLDLQSNNIVELDGLCC
jgi:hypothetical protein